MSNLTFRTKSRCVNSKILYKEINDFIVQGLKTMDVAFGRTGGREQLIMVLFDFFNMLFERGSITQCDIICDLRNNKVSDMENGQFRMTVTYKQRNCLNTTEIEYHIDVQDSPDWTIDFMV